METLEQIKTRIAVYDNPVDNNDIVVAFPFNLHNCGGLERTDGIICITADKIIIFENGTRGDEIPLAEIDRFEIQGCIGCGFLNYYDNDGDCHQLCRGDAKIFKYYTALVRKLNRYLDGYEFDYSYEDEINIFCEKCGRRLSPLTKTCSYCSKKGGYIKRLLSMLKPYKFHIIAMSILYFVLSGVGLIWPYLDGVLVDDYIKAPQEPSLVSFILVILAIIGVNLLSRVISLTINIISAKFTNRLLSDWRRLIFEKIQQMSLSHLEKRPQGMLMNIVTGDTYNITDFLSNVSGNAINQVVTFLAVTTFLFIYDWRMALFVLAPVPLTLFIIYKYHKKLRKRFVKQWRATDKLNHIMFDIFSGIRVVKSYGTEKNEIERFDETAADLRDKAIWYEKYGTCWNQVILFLLGLGSYFILYYSGSQILSGKMTLGYMTMITSYINMIYGPLNWMTELPQRFITFTTCLARIIEIIDEKCDVADKDDAKQLDIKGNIKFENASFGYNSAIEILHNINLNIKPGEMLGIVGKSGSGKSTLINLVMRLYDVDEGCLKIDGVNIKDISQESLRKQIGVVLQETFLFSGTIYENITYAKPNATYDEVITAAKLAGAHKFIMKLPNAYNTKVGEHGYTLSGGERQRISIARAVLHDPKILILDEATAALDTETEKQIQDALQILIKDRTTLAIAHRLSTLRNATKLLVIDRGRVAELGSHDELMKKKGIYYGLIMAQRQMSKMAKNN